MNTETYQSETDTEQTEELRKTSQQKSKLLTVALRFSMERHMLVEQQAAACWHETENSEPREASLD